MFYIFRVTSAAWESAREKRMLGTRLEKETGGNYFFFYKKKDV
jgi:hypothetical protein